MGWPGVVRGREIGICHPLHFKRVIVEGRTDSLELSHDKDIVCAHHAPVNCVDLDGAECRYLLAGGGDGKVSLYDVVKPVDTPPGTYTIHPLHVIQRGPHRFAVASVCWYPHDTGLFVTASLDETVKVWDSNALEAVCSFKLNGKVFGACMSPCATTHTLIACGSEDPRIRLCDLRTGGFTHTLMGHQDTVLTTVWSPGEEFVLASGSVDCTVRLWDVRRAGCLMALNQHAERVSVNWGRSNSSPGTIPRTQGGQSNSTPATETSHYGAVNGSCFTPDGRFLLSVGRDGRVHLWNAHTGRDTLAGLPNMTTPVLRGLALYPTASSSGTVVYVPDGVTIRVYNIVTGQHMNTLRGHYGPVTCCTFNPALQELYTGGQDHAILVWSPRQINQSTTTATTVEDHDDWSDG